KVRVYPARIEITPDKLQIQTGDQRQMTARALDANGQPIAGVGFVWRTALSGIASIDSSGMLRAVSEGTVTVAALVDIGVAGYEFSAQTQVRVRRRADFLLTRIAASD